MPQLPTPGFDVTVSQMLKKNGAQGQDGYLNTPEVPEGNVTCSSLAVPSWLT